MRVFEWLLGGMAGWTAIGLLGTILSVAVGDRRKVRRGLAWLAGVWVIYLGALLLVSRYQSQRVIAPGQEVCFDKVCFAVTGTTTVGEFKGAGGGQLLQVGVRMTNRSSDLRGVEGLQAYLVDGSGRRWGQTVGVGGVALTSRLPVGRQTESDPVFRVDGMPGELSLVLTRGWTGWGWLTIGDTDSLLHRPDLLRLE